jgi:hypothetical protein
MDNNGNYMIPANSKKGQLILNFFRPSDLALFSVGIISTIIFLIVFSGYNNTMLTVSCLIPLLVTGFLVLPIPNYHNVRCFLGNMYRFYSGRKKFYWRGWCVSKYGNNSKHE